MKNESSKPRDFRLYLQGEYLKKKERNPTFSLRAFARALGSDISTLSKLLSGRRSIGALTIRRFGARLGLSPVELAEFLERKEGGRISGGPAKEGVDPDYLQISLDHFQIISDWYHYAILELTWVANFRGDVRWVSRELGLSLVETRAAVERLRRVELLEITPEGKWLDRSEGFATTIGNAFTAPAFRKLQRQVLERAIDALENLPLDVRDQTSMTMAIDSARLPEARGLIKKFRRDLERFLADSPRRDRVYQLGISLYPLSHLQGDRK